MFSLSCLEVYCRRTGIPSFNCAVEGVHMLDAEMSVNVQLVMEHSLWQEFRLPFLRFNSNRTEVSGSLQLHFSPSFQLSRLNYRISSLVILIPVFFLFYIYINSLTFYRTSKLIHCVSLPLCLVVHAQPLFFPVSPLTSIPPSSCWTYSPQTPCADKY